jgi:hypothetical protein
MSALRRHIRVWTLAWLVFQAASLSAFVPRDCCAAHGAHRAHQEAAPAAAGEAQCPMHRPAAPEPECSLRSVCDGPLLALPAVWSTPGPVPASLTLAPDASDSENLTRGATRPLSADVLPKTPPPRA